MLLLLPNTKAELSSENQISKKCLPATMSMTASKYLCDGTGSDFKGCIFFVCYNEMGQTLEYEDSSKCKMDRGA